MKMSHVCNQKSYFEYGNPLISLAIIVGLLICHCGCYCPHIIPDQYMGPIGWLYRFLVYTHPVAIQITYHVALVVHFAEAVYSIHLMNSKGITDFSTRVKWFIQTLLFGFNSLHFLVKYKAKNT